MFTVKISSTQKELDGIIDLRYNVLRKPWNQPKETATDELELSSINVYVEKSGNIIACGRLQDNGEYQGQIRYMAVDSIYQGKGLGKLIISKIEIEARRINLQTLELQARENAVEFYKSQGYVIKEKTFKLWGIIQHYLMMKGL